MLLSVGASQAAMRKVSEQGQFNAFVKDTKQKGVGVAMVHGIKWCPLCQTTMPRFQKLVDNHPKTAFADVDVDRTWYKGLDNNHPIKRGVHGVPTFIFFQKGERRGGMVVGSKDVGKTMKKIRDRIKSIRKSSHAAGQKVRKTIKGSTGEEMEEAISPTTGEHVQGTPIREMEEAISPTTGEHIQGTPISSSR